MRRLGVLVLLVAALVVSPAAVALAQGDGGGSNGSSFLDYGDEVLLLTLGVVGGAIATYWRDRRIDRKAKLDELLRAMDEWETAIDNYETAIERIVYVQRSEKSPDEVAEAGDNLKRARRGIERAKLRLVPRMTRTGQDQRREDRFWEKLEEQERELLEALQRDENKLTKAALGKGPPPLPEEKALHKSLDKIRQQLRTIRGLVETEGRKLSVSQIVQTAEERSPLDEAA